MDLPIHILTGTILTPVVSKFFGVKDTIGFFCLTSFLDVDHYIYYIVKFRNWHLGHAIKYFSSHKDVERFCLCVFHTVEFFFLFGLIAYFFRISFLYACFFGVSLHYIIDIAQALYYKRMHYRWWSVINYFRTIKGNINSKEVT